MCLRAIESIYPTPASHHLSLRPACCPLPVGPNAQGAHPGSGPYTCPGAAGASPAQPVRHGANDAAGIDVLLWRQLRHCRAWRMQGDCSTGSLQLRCCCERFGLGVALGSGPPCLFRFHRHGLAIVQVNNAMVLVSSWALSYRVLASGAPGQRHEQTWALRLLRWGVLVRLRHMTCVCLVPIVRLLTGGTAKTACTGAAMCACASFHRHPLPRASNPP